MNLNCIVCLKQANILYKGNSLCKDHYLELEESGRGDTFLEVIIKRYVKQQEQTDSSNKNKLSMPDLQDPPLEGKTR